MKTLNTTSFTTLITTVTHSDQYGKKLFNLVGEQEREEFIKTLKNSGWKTSGLGYYTKGIQEIELRVNDNLCHDHNWKGLKGLL